MSAISTAGFAFATEEIASSLGCLPGTCSGLLIRPSLSLSDMHKCNCRCVVSCRADMQQQFPLVLLELLPSRTLSSPPLFGGGVDVFVAAPSTFLQPLLVHCRFLAVFHCVSIPHARPTIPQSLAPLNLGLGQQCLVNLSICYFLVSLNQMCPQRREVVCPPQSFRPDTNPTSDRDSR